MLRKLFNIMNKISNEIGWLMSEKCPLIVFLLSLGFSRLALARTYQIHMELLLLPNNVKKRNETEPYINFIPTVYAAASETFFNNGSVVSFACGEKKNILIIIIAWNKFYSVILAHPYLIPSYKYAFNSTVSKWMSWCILCAANFFFVSRRIENYFCSRQNYSINYLYQKQFRLDIYCGLPKLYENSVLLKNFSLVSDRTTNKLSPAASTALVEAIINTWSPIAREFHRIFFRRFIASRQAFRSGGVFTAQNTIIFVCT